jgi:16S rRNA (uracil1498-N3)-methyltransferase
MTRKCFLIDHQDLGVEMFTLADDVAHHMRNVLRLKPGDSIELRDGQGNGWSAIIKEMKGREVRVGACEEQVLENESPLQLTLALALSRFDRMELALRQATEMGAHRFIAFRADHSDYQLPASHQNRRKERWGKITREALCQCGRMRLPEIAILSDSTALITAAPSWEATEGKCLTILAREDEDRQSLTGLHRVHPVCRQMLVVIGPEGGWSRREGEQFEEAGFYSVHLGPRVLRLETAAVGLLAAVQLLWGDLGAECGRKKRYRGADDNTKEG